MSVAEVAADLTELCKHGKFAEAMEKHYAPNCVSIESMGPNPVSEGKDAIRAKTQWWIDNMEVHEIDVEGPYVNSNTDSFAVKFTMDVTMRANGQRTKSSEIGVYKVEDGKVVSEQFIAQS